MNTIHYSGNSNIDWLASTCFAKQKKNEVTWKGMNEGNHINKNGLASSTGDLEIQLQQVRIFNTVSKCTK